MDPPVSASRSTAASRIEARLRARCRAVTDGELASTALVVAPHFDDETLGCGGTLARKARLGAEIEVVFLTDGAASHGDGVDRRRLSELRREEADAALSALGLDPDRVVHGDLADGALGSELDAAVEIVAAALARVEPRHVFVPHWGDGHPDHAAATAATVAAIEAAGSDVDLYEYPVWHWQQWPWVRLASPLRRRGWGPAELHGDAWRRSVRSRFGLRFASSLNRVVDIGDTLALKRAALARYRSQMERPDGGDGPTLADVSFGHLLERLTADREHYRVSRPAAPDPGGDRRPVSS